MVSAIVAVRVAKLAEALADPGPMLLDTVVNRMELARPAAAGSLQALPAPALSPTHEDIPK